MALPLLDELELPGVAAAPAGVAGRLQVFAESFSSGIPPQLATVLPSGQVWPVWATGMYAGFFQASGGTTVLTGHSGFLLTATGTATAVNSSNGSRYTRMPKIEALVTTASATAVAGLRRAELVVFSGSGTVDGGYSLIIRGGPATGVATATSRFFMGVTPGTGAPTDVEPSSLLNSIGVGYDSADTNLQVMFRGSGAVTKVDTGMARPTTDRTAMYEVTIYQPPGATQAAHVFVRDLISGATFSTSQTTAGNLPAANTGLSPRIWSSAGGTSSVIGVALHSMYCTSDF